MDDWVLADAPEVPLRNPAQFGQLQFHCGKPPPAADPRTRIFTGGGGGERVPSRGPKALAELSATQRLATYMVISMPNRNSTACGVSHFMNDSFGNEAHDAPPPPRVDPHTH